jgi:transposase
MPHIKITSYEVKGNQLCYSGHITKKGCKCPDCGKTSYQVRSRYTRKLMDIPLGSHPVLAMITVRKFRCSNNKCFRKIFSEQLANTIVPRARKTDRVMRILQTTLVEVSSRKGAYLTEIMKIKQSPSTCLRIVSCLSIPDKKDVEMIGIDDWAFRKGVNYGSIIVDISTGNPIDLLHSRNDCDVIEWLKKHSAISIVTRDRASSYAKSISTALPNAIQIADKFHVVKNLSERIQETIKKHYGEIKASFLSSLVVEEKENTLKESKEILENGLTVAKICSTDSHQKHKLELFNQIHELHAKGISQRKIASSLGIHRETVRGYLKHTTLPKKRIVFTHKYTEYLDTINESCRAGKNVKKIFADAKASGFKGQLTAFYSWFNKNYPNYNPKEDDNTLNIVEINKPSMLFNSLSPTKMSIYVSNPDWGINQAGKCSKEHTLMSGIIESSDLLKRLRDCIVSFKNILKGNIPEALDDWMDRMEKFNIRGLNSFINGLKKDLIAVKNAISYTWTNGLVEGNVNRLKNKKREMYGRAGFELLRRKVILSKMG